MFDYMLQYTSTRLKLLEYAKWKCFILHMSKQNIFTLNCISSKERKHVRVSLTCNSLFYLIKVTIIGETYNKQYIAIICVKFGYNAQIDTRQPME